MVYVVMIHVSDSRDDTDESRPKLLLESVLGDEQYDTLSDCNAAAGMAFYNWLLRNVSEWDPSNVSQRIAAGCVVHMHSGKATMRRTSVVENLVLQLYAKEKTEADEPTLEHADSDSDDDADEE